MGVVPHTTWNTGLVTHGPITLRVKSHWGAMILIFTTQLANQCICLSHSNGIENGLSTHRRHACQIWINRTFGIAIIGSRCIATA
jgi:hypothetical protein